MNEYKKDVYFEALIENQLAHKEHLVEELEQAEIITDRVMKLLLSPIEERIFILASNKKKAPWKEISQELHIPKMRAVWYMEKIKRRLLAFQKFLETIL